MRKVAMTLPICQSSSDQHYTTGGTEPDTSIKQYPHKYVTAQQ